MDQASAAASPRIVKESNPFLASIITVANLMDAYLANVASDVDLRFLKFYARSLSDGIYRFIDNNSEVDASNGNSTTKTFTFRELAMATNNFRQECLLGEGAFGRIFRGTLQSSGQIVAVRQLDRSGTQGSKEFQVEVLVLSLLRHPNLINMVGYCADGDQRLLVYEYMPAGSLTKHLFDIPENQKPLDWATRMKIAAGIAQGLEYLHEKANPPVIYRDLKSSNILLDDVNNPKLSDYGLTKLVLSGNKMHLSPTMASYGYSAPEYENHGELTLKSDVYSFGVVLLELITGRKAVDPTQPKDEQNLVIWAQPFFRDPKKFPDMADSILNKEFPVTSLNQAVGVAAMCLTEEPMVRPMIGDVVAALSFLASPPPPDAPMNPPTPLAPILSKRAENTSQHGTIDQENISSHHHKNVDSTSAKGHRNEHEYENDNKEEGYDGSMDFKYVETSDSEHEDRTGISYSVQTKSQNIDSAVSSWRSNRTSSFGYSSRGFSLRCESINRERDVNSHSNLDNEQFCDDYHASSSGDEEPTSVPVSRHVSRDRSASITSRRSSGSFMR